MTKSKNSGLHLINEDLSILLAERHCIEKSDGSNSLSRLGGNMEQ